jgi:hypothetical protein
MATQHKGAIHQQNIYPKIIIKKKNSYMHILNFNTTQKVKYVLIIRLKLNTLLATYFF